MSTAYTKSNRPGAWSEAEHQQLRELYPTRRTPEVARILSRSEKSVSSRAKLLGIYKAIGNGGRECWTTKDVAMIREFYPHISTEKLAKQLGHSLLATYRRAHQLGLRKTREYLDSPAACRLRRGEFSQRSIAARFRKGQIPHNKGLRRPGWFRGRMRETQFKRGQLNGHAAKHYMPLWTFRVNTDGYLLLKTGKRSPAPNDRWEFVHRMIWEQAHGPISEGYRIWWKDGDHLNNSLSNLEMVSGAEHMARTTIQNFPPELKQVMQLRGAVNRAITMRRRNGEEQNQRSA